MCAAWRGKTLHNSDPALCLLLLVNQVTSTFDYYFLFINYY
jgi:hypothetical protein